MLKLLIWIVSKPFHNKFMSHLNHPMNYFLFLYLLCVKKLTSIHLLQCLFILWLNYCFLINVFSTTSLLCLFFSLMMTNSTIQVFTAMRSSQLHVPYRNSKLTQILRPCLGGDAKVSSIALVCQVYLLAIFFSPYLFNPYLCLYIHWL